MCVCVRVRVCVGGGGGGGEGEGRGGRGRLLANLVLVTSRWPRQQLSPVQRLLPLHTLLHDALVPDVQLRFRVGVYGCGEGDVVVWGLSQKVQRTASC